MRVRKSSARKTAQAPDPPPRSCWHSCWMTTKKTTRPILQAAGQCASWQTSHKHAPDCWPAPFPPQPAGRGSEVVL
eukprot:5068618-Pyramimonas_sp.AAC.1